MDLSSLFLLFNSFFILKKISEHSSNRLLPLAYYFLVFIVEKIFFLLFSICERCIEEGKKIGYKRHKRAYTYIIKVYQMAGHERIFLLIILSGFLASLPFCSF